MSKAKAKAPIQAELAQGCLEIAAELARGPELFAPQGGPSAAVQRYTGARTLQDPERCRLAGAMRLLKWSDRKIAEALGCDTRLIDLMVTECERNGWIPALKARLERLVAANAEKSQIALSELLERAANGGESPELAGMIKAVGTVGSFAIQSHQLLTGQATQIIAQKGGAGREEIEQWFRDSVRAVDVEVSTELDRGSSVKAGKCLQIEGSQDRDTRHDTSKGGDQGAGGPDLAGPDGKARGAAEAGGGVAGGGGSASTDGSGGAKI